jgi:hypothetical protein
MGDSTAVHSIKVTICTLEEDYRSERAAAEGRCNEGIGKPRLWMACSVALLGGVLRNLVVASA